MLHREGLGEQCWWLGDLAIGHAETVADRVDTNAVGRITGPELDLLHGASARTPPAPSTACLGTIFVDKKSSVAVVQRVVADRPKRLASWSSIAVRGLDGKVEILRGSAGG